MPERYLNVSIQKYLDDLSAKLPAPGGGSAAALVSSVGVSLLSMVANFTLNKKGYEKYDDEIKDTIAKLDEARREVSKLIDDDVEAYNNLSATYKLPKNTQQEIKQRDEKIQLSLKDSLAVPCKIFEISVDVLPLAFRLAEIGNKNLISDVSCGASILKAGIESAKFNIDINLKFITDAEFVKETKIKYEKMLKVAFEDIEKIIKFEKTGEKQ